MLKLGSLFDGLYLISDDGKLYSTRSKRYLKHAVDKYGYIYYVISINGKRSTHKAHRLVAVAFIPNPENKPTVDHKNGIRADNRVENLIWATVREQFLNPTTRKNLQNVWDGTDYQAKGKLRNFGKRKTIVYRSGKKMGEYQSLLLATQYAGVSCAKASECANGKRKSTGGFEFCYD